MTATDIFRAMLDERGVEWREVSPNKTKWRHGGIEYVATNAWPRNDATRTKLVLHAMLTPEQAVEATMGMGECRYEWSLADNGWADHTCSACGYVENTDIHVGLGWNFCPNCGAKVVGPTTNGVDAEVDE